MRVTCLVDNTVRRSSDFWGEHGVSFHIETSDRWLLYDTGTSGTVLMHNLDVLGIPAQALDVLVLSHAHGDHTGGLKELLPKCRADLPMYAHPDIFRPRYSVRDGKQRSIGLAIERERLEKNVWLRLSAEPVEVLPGVWTSGEISPRPEPEGRSAHHFVREGDSWLPDPYRDDMALVLETDTGLVVMCGCCHAGLLNTLSHARRIFEREVVAVIGGTHLLDADQDTLRHVVEVLRSTYNSPRLYPNHCTGQRAYVTLATAFGGRVAPCPAGTILNF